MRLHDININEAELAQACTRLGICGLYFFGSIVRDSFGPDSDIDVLVELEPNVANDLFELGYIQDELTRFFGRQVHLHTRDMLPPKYADYFLRDALHAYA